MTYLEEQKVKWTENTGGFKSKDSSSELVWVCVWEDERRIIYICVLAACVDVFGWALFILSAADACFIQPPGSGNSLA